MTKKLRYLIHFFAFLLFIAGGIAFMHHSDNYRFDPDRFYHFALSKHMVEKSDYIPRELPQVVGLHWDKYFPDKEFLFHQLTALGYKLNGEKGTIAAVGIVGLLGIFSLYLLAADIVSPLIALILSITLMESFAFLDRLSLLRPHVLAIFLFTLLLHALHKRSAWLGFISTALMTLAYHGLFIPLVPILIASIIFFLFPLDKKKEKNFVLASLAGLIIGVLINPYFPSNLVLGWLIARIPSLMHGDLAQVGFGSELYPIDTYSFLIRMPVPLIVLALAGFSLLKKNTDEKLEQDKLIFTICGGIFFLICLQSPRGKEYWIPISVVLAAILYQNWHDYKKIRVIAVVASLIFPIHFIYTFYSLPMSKNKVTYGEIEAIKMIPQSDTGALVFNCDWDATPYILYTRPDLRFLDILDPSLLYFMNKEAFLARQELSQMHVGDIYGLIHDAFKAKYSMCEGLEVVSLMRQDPDFIEIYPGNMPTKSDTHQPVLFRLRDTGTPVFLHKFTVFPLHNTTVENYKIKNPDSAKNEPAIEVTEPTSFLSLSTYAKKALSAEKSDIHCALTTLDKKEMKTFVGASYLGLGGGRNIRVWRNGKPFYSTVNGVLAARRVEVLVPIPNGLSANDQFSMITCSSTVSPFWGLAVSFWSKAKIESICREKEVSQEKNTDGLPWEFKGVSQETCLGPIVPPAAQKL